MQGQEIGSYILESPLGRGGMGEVWLARHKSLEIRAAIKVLTLGSDEPQFHERFSREARTQASLSHPNIARVLDHVQKDGRWYLITEYMARGTLRDALRQSPGPVPVDQALAWARQALQGLEHAHQKGIVHRDVKPANILLNDRGEAAVTDFGLAKIAGGERLTQTGTAIGTPAYMSPEQLGGASEIDHRTDLYSLGVVLYELLTGRVPFPMESASEVVRILVNEPPPLQEINPDLPAELGEIVLKALAKDPQARYADAAEFAGAIAAFEARRDAGDARPAAVVPPPLPPNLAAGRATAVTAAPTAVTAPPTAAPAPDDGGPVAVLSANARRPPIAARGGTSPGAVAAMLALLAAMVLALAAGAAYFLWPAMRDVLFADGNEPAHLAELGEDPSEGARNGAGEAPATEEEPASPEAAAREYGLGSAVDAKTPETVSGDGGGTARSRPLEAGPARLDRGTPAVAGLEHREEARADAGSGSVRAGEVTDPARSFVPEPAAPQPAAPDPVAPRPPAGAPRRVPLPPDPTVAVIALGDPLFARDFEQEVESRLLGLGVDVADEHNSAIVSDVLRRWGDDVAVPELLPLLGEAGFQALVLIQVEYVGARDLYYLGRHSVARQARLRLNAYLVSGDGALGPGWNEDVEYTELSAGRNAEAAMLAATSEMTDAIRYGWRQYRREAGS